MKLMVIGGGGREHAIIKKLKENPAVEKIYCLPGNGGIAADAVCVSEIGAKDIPAQVEFAKAHGIDYAVVAPDDPLALGAVDALSAAGIPCFGPDKKAAVIEASKAFAKDLMQKYNIPTAKYRVFTDAPSACAYIDAEGAPIVVKADGLALGRWSPPWTTSVRSTVTKAPTPAAWARSRRTRIIQRRLRRSAWRISSCRRSARCAPRAAPSAAASISG